MNDRDLPLAQKFGSGEDHVYARSLVETMMEAHDRFYLEESDFVRTITIDALGVGTTEFDLPRERAMQLYNSGRAGAEEFLTHKWVGPRGFPLLQAVQ